MSICNLDENKELAKVLANQVYNKILNNLKTPDKPFKILEVVRDVYYMAYEKNKDQAKSLGIAAVIPTVFFKVIEDNPKLLTQLIDKNFDLKAVRNFELLVNKSEDPLKEIANYIKVGTKTSMKVILENSVTTPETQSEVSNENQILELVLNKILTSLSLQNSTGQQLEEVSGLPIFTKTNAGKNFYYNVLTKVLEANTTDNANYSNVEYSGHKGFKLKPIVENTLPDLEKNIYPGATLSSKRIILALTNNKGEFLYFNDKGEIASKEDGKIVYFYMKDSSDAKVKALKEELLKSNETALREQSKNDPLEYSRLRNELISKINQMVNEEKKQSDLISKSVMDNQPILLDITGGKKGYHENTDETFKKITDPEKLKQYKSLVEKTLSQFNLTDTEIESIAIAYADMMVKGVVKTLNLPSIKINNIDKPISLKGRNLLAGDRSLFDSLISVLIDDLVYENGKPLSPADRQSYFNNYASKLDRSVFNLSIVNNEIVISLNGQQLDLSDKVQAKEQLVKTLGAKLFANFSTDLKNKVTIERFNIKDGVVSVQPINYIKDYVLQNMIPRIAFDSTTERPLVANGYFSFEPTNETAVVEQEVKEVVNNAKTIIQEDTDEEDKLESLLRSKLIESIATPEQKDKAKTWWEKSALSKAKDSNGKPLITLKEAFNLVNSDAWASFSNATITLFAGSDYTHNYHEAWHAFSQIYLSKSDRNKLYEAVGQLPGTFTVTRKNESNNIQTVKVKFTEASRKELEEFIAEEFRVYAMNNGKFKTQNEKSNIFSRIFDRVWKFLKTLFKGTTDINVYSNPGSQGILSEMFNQLYTAESPEQLNMYTPSMDNAEFGVLNSGIIAKDGTVIFTPVEASLLVKSMDGIISDITTGYLLKGKYDAAANILKGQERLTLLYNSAIKKKLASRLDVLRKEFEADYAKNKNDKTKWDKIERKYKRNNVLLLIKALDNYGDASNSLNGKGDKLDLITYHLQNSSFNEMIDENYESPLSKSGREGGNETESYELATADCTYILKTLLKQEVVNGERVNILNSLGFPEPINHKQFFNNLIDKVGGEKRVDELYKKLASVKNTSPLFAQLLEKLGDPTVVMGADKGAGASKIWMGVFRSLNLEREDLVTSKFKEENINGETEVSFVVGKVSADHSAIKNKVWPAKFSTESGPFVTVNANKENTLNLSKVVKEFLTSSTIGKEGITKYFIKDESLKIPFLNAIGMYLEDNYDVRKAINDDTTKAFDYIVNAIGLAEANKDILAKRNLLPITNIVNFLGQKHNKIKIELATGEFIEGAIDNQASNVNTLAKIDAEFSTENISRMKLTAEKSKKSAFSLNTTLTQIVYALKKAGSLDELKSGAYSYVPHLVKENNPHVIGSVIMNSLFDTTGKRNNLNGIELVDLTGSQYEDLSDDSNGVSHGSMTKVDKFITDFASMLKDGYIEAVRHGEKSTYTGVKVKRLNTYSLKKNNHLYVDTQAFLKDLYGNYLLGYNPFDKVMDIMIPKLEGELRRIQKIKDNKEYYSKAKDFYEKGIKFDYFDDILNTKDGELKNKLINEYASQLNDETTLNSLLNKNLELRKEIEKEIINYFDTLKRSLEVNNYDRVFGNNVPNFLRSIAEEHLTEDQVATSDSIKDALLYSFAINSSLHANEVILLELGDGFQFNHINDESLKRVPTYNSSGSIFPTDDLAKLFINTHVKRPYEDSLVKSGKLVRRDPNQTESRLYTGKGNKAIIKESKVDSIYLDDYAEMFRHWLKEKKYQGDIEEALYGKGGSKTKITGGLLQPYTGIKDGDGQGWISFDSYRILKNLENSWTEQQEAAYQKELRGESLTPEELTDLFPVYKLQYAGPLVTELKNYPIQSIDKFSLLPLIPSVIKGLPLEKMHLAMMAQNIDYALFDSGAKRSYLRADDKTNGDSIYEGDTSNIKEYQDINFTPNPIYFEYLKNQTEVNKYFKGKSVLSTQLRKVFNVGLFDNGVPIDYKGTKEEWNSLTKAEKLKNSNAYKNTQQVYKQLKRLTEYMRKDLLEEMGWTEVNGLPEGNIDDMITYVVDILKSQGYSDHEIDFVQYSSNKKIDLSLSPQAARLEKLLMSVINNRLIKLKIKGEPLVQVSSALTQTFKKPTKEQTKEYDDFGTNGLSGYIVSTNGSKETIGAKVKVALTDNYQNLFSTNYYVNGKKTTDKVAVYVKNPDTESEIKYVLDYDASFIRLNEMIKNESWLEENENSIRMTGVRIPTQGPNSVEFVQIHEFLPASAGPVIIIPAEVVAKSGGDFDVDKLTMYIKYITKQGSELKDTYKTPEEVDAKIQELKTKLKSLKADNLTIKEDLDDFRETIKIENNHRRISKEKFFAYTTYNNEELLKTLSDPKEQEFIKNNLKYSYEILSKQIKGFNVEKYSEIENLITELVSKDSELSRAYNELSNLKEHKRNFTAAIQNKFIDNIIGVMEMPEMAFSLMQPNDTHLTKPLSNKLKKDIQKADNEVDHTKSIKTGESTPGGGVSPTKMTEYAYNLKKQQDNITGKNILGLIALHNTFSNMLTMAGAKMNYSFEVEDPYKSEGTAEKVKVPIKLRLNYNKTKEIDSKTLKEIEVISLSNKTDAEKINNIADILSQLMNGAVDVGKDAWISYLQGNMEVMPKTLFLLQAGVPIEDIAYFVSNPMIRKYVEAKTNYKSPLAKIIYGPKHKTTTTSAKNKARRELLKGVMVDLDGKQLKNNIAGFYKILNTRYKDVSFSKESLEGVAKQSFAFNKEQTAGLLQYFYIEDLIEEFDNLKGYLNVDTESAVDNFAAQAKIHEIEKIDKFKTLDSSLKIHFKEESAISSFFIQEFSRALFGKNLFATRDNDLVTKFLIKTLENPIERAILKQETGLDEETFINRFKNALSLYIFTNVLKQYKQDASEYKQTPISELLNENSPVKSIEQLRSDFANKNYLSGSKSDEAYLRRGLFYIHPSAFDENDVESFIEFSLEREYLRKIKSLESLLGTKEFQSAKNRLVNSGVSLFVKREGESQEDYTNRLNKIVYEYVLMHEALSNTYNNYELFRSGEHTTARKLISIIESYPELKLQFDLVRQFSASPISSKKNHMSRTNFKIKNLTELDENLSEEYYNEWLKLANPKEMKVSEKTANRAQANAYISEFFAQLPTVAFLQSGMDSSEFSLNSIMPYDRYRPVMEKASEAFYTFLNKNESKANTVLEGFYKFFKENNKTENNRLKGRGISYKRSVNQLLADATSQDTYLFDKPYVSKIDDGVYVISQSYEDPSTNQIKSLPAGELQMLKQGNPDIVFILNDNDLQVNLNISTEIELEQAKADIDTAINKIKESGKIIVLSDKGFGKPTQPQAPVSTQRTFKDEALHQAYIKGGLEAVTKLIQKSKKKELDAAKQLSKEVNMLEEFEQLNSKPNKTNSENDRLIELYTILKNSEELDFEYSLNELGLTTKPQAPVSNNPFKTSKVQQKVYHVDKRKGLNENTLVDDMTMMFPTGVFFTTEKEYAENYAKAIGGVIYEAYIDVQNPLTTTNKQEIERLGRKPDEVPTSVDSVIHKSDNAKADIYGKVGTEIVIYKPEQIKLIVPTQAPITTTQPTSLGGELSVYLSNKLKDEFGYDNPGNSDALSPLDILNRQVIVTKQDIDDKKLNC